MTSWPPSGGCAPGICCTGTGDTGIRRPSLAENHIDDVWTHLRLVAMMRAHLGATGTNGGRGIMPDISVEPYWELTFDAGGDVNAAQAERLRKQATERRITDLVVF